MKRMLLTLAALVLFATPALALPDGPDGNIFGTGYFEISVSEANAPPPTAPLPLDNYETKRFYLTDGWDFGDRYAYACAWAEYFQGANEKFEVHIEMVPYEFTVLINDRYGAEVQPDSTEADLTLCGDGVGVGVTEEFDGSDHFPHLIHPGDGLTFYQNGEPLLDPQGDPVVLDLTDAQCSKAYWVPGDEPGEAWLWWDEDGPTGGHQEGTNDLPCGGGAIEPVAVARMTVHNADPDIGYCTHSLHEDQCANVVTTADVALTVSVINDNGGTATASDFTVSATGPNTVSGPGPSVSGTVDPGSYDLAVTGPPGYTAGAWSCPDPLSLAAGDTQSCAVTLTDDFTAATGTGTVTLDDGRVVEATLTVFGFPFAQESCGTGTITLSDGRDVEATICA